MIGRERLAAIAIALSLFGSGVGVGVALDRFEPEPARPWFARRRPDLALARYQEELDLDAAQQADILPVLERRWQETVALVKRTVPEEEASRQKAHAEIRALLRPDQQQRLDALIERRAARRKLTMDQLGP